jgi:Arc/MetJ-type ribon-helix-helix transcriptional regulator
MGRPPLFAKPTVVRLSDDVRARIVALVGAGRMAEFVRQAVEAELARRERAAVKAREPGKADAGR